MKLQRNHLAQRAFTLVEMLLVLVILAVLAAIVIPKMAGRGKQAKETAAKVDIHAYESALDQFETDNDSYPQSLDALVNQPSNARNWQGPYVKEIKNDPWGNPYTYTLSPRGGAGAFEITSAGPDGRAGTEDDISSSGGGKKR